MSDTRRSTARGLNRVPSTRRRRSHNEETDVVTVNGTRMVRRRERIRYRLFTLGLGLDMPMLFLVLILLAVGLVMLFSASYAYAYYYYGNSYHFVTRQGIFALIGVALMMFISTFDYHHLHRLNVLIFTIAVVLLVALLVFRGTPIAPNRNGAYRWIKLFGLEFQPSEVAKFALILMFSHLIALYGPRMGTFRYGVVPFFGVLGLIGGLVILERHVSATIIIALVAMLLMFIGGTKLRYFLALGGIGAAGLTLVIFSDRFQYAMERVQGWLDPFNPPAGIDTWQTVQSLYAIGSGQLLGVGIGQSRQKYLYLPEPQNDFIFAIVCEELGFIGALIVIILFALFIWRGVYISLHARDRFGTLLGLGITFQFGIQAILNICVVTNTVPNTGIALPFFSYGGTALVMLLAEMGVLLSISRHSNIEKT